MMRGSPRTKDGVSSSSLLLPLHSSCESQGAGSTVHTFLCLGGSMIRVFSSIQMMFSASRLSQSTVV